MMRARSIREILLAAFVVLLFPAVAGAQETTETGELASRPLFRDPVYDGAADPTLIWNREEAKWFMFYTNRRTNVEGLRGVTWVHGTHIGIAESSDGGATWTYRGTANIPAPYTETQWAPDVIEHHGTYHMFLTYVPGEFENWNHPRDIIHLTSENLVVWKYESTLDLASNRVIDADVMRLPDGRWRLWYNNEVDGKSMYFADSNDLYHWIDKGKAVGDQSGEGPTVFAWNNTYWMITDVWDGLGVYKSEDLDTWERIPGNLLQTPGTGEDDKVIGQHPDVVVNGDRAWLFYFTHPGRREGVARSNWREQRRSSIQVVELKYENGRIVCDRDAPTYVDLGSPE